MRIAFDGTTLRPGRTGVGYYTEHLLQHLAREAEATGDEVVVVSNRRVETAAPLPKSVRIFVDHRCPLRTLWMQVFAPRVLAAIRPDVAHFTNSVVPLASGIPSVTTIHDMSLSLYPQYHPLRRVVLNRPLVGLAARHVDAVITVSRSARRDILELYGLPADRVHVVHEAAAPEFRPIRDPALLAAVRRRYRLPDRFALYVGTIEPRKNLPRLFEAFAARYRRGELQHELVCVGPYGWGSRDLRRRLKRLGISHAVHFTGYVPFSALPALYNLSDIFVFPSLYEGFGLPVIEAMACGVPVITSQNSSLTEVAGGAVEAIDALDTEALGAAIVRLAWEKDRRLELSRRGLERARAFSWERAARETLGVYRAAAQLDKHAPALQPAPVYGGVRVDKLTGPPAAAQDHQPPWR